MNGSGTQDEPYTVTNWDELFDACSQKGKYVNLETDLDGNDYNNGIWDKAITIECASLDGKKHTIKNIIDFDKKRIFVQKEKYNTRNVKNLNFKSIISRGPFATGQYYNNRDTYPLTFENCNFELYCMCLFDGSENSTLKFKNCSIYYAKPCGELCKVEFERCNVYIKITGSGYAIGTSETDGWATIKSAIDSRIEIYCPYKCMFGWGSNSSEDNTTRKPWYMSTFSGCVLSIKSDDPESEVVWVEDYNLKNSKKSVINISGIKHIRQYSNGLVYYLENIAENHMASNGTVFLSEENMKDKAYLNSIGFAVE